MAARRSERILARRFGLIPAATGLMAFSLSRMVIMSRGTLVGGLADEVAEAGDGGDEVPDPDCGERVGGLHRIADVAEGRALGDLRLGGGLRGLSMGGLRSGRGQGRSREDRRCREVTFGKTTMKKMERFRGGSLPEMPQAVCHIRTIYVGSRQGAHGVRPSVDKGPEVGFRDPDLTAESVG